MVFTINNPINVLNVYLYMYELPKRLLKYTKFVEILNSFTKYGKIIKFKVIKLIKNLKLKSLVIL